MSITISGNEPSVRKAVVWLREHLQISPHQMIDLEFAEYFNCRIVMEKILDGTPMMSILFDNEEDAIIFQLRWS